MIEMDSIPRSFMPAVPLNIPVAASMLSQAGNPPPSASVAL